MFQGVRRGCKVLGCKVLGCEVLGCGVWIWSCESFVVLILELAWVLGGRISVFSDGRGQRFIRQSLDDVLCRFPKCFTGRVRSQRGWLRPKRLP